VASECSPSIVIGTDPNLMLDSDQAHYRCNIAAEASFAHIVIEECREGRRVVVRDIHAGLAGLAVADSAVEVEMRLDPVRTVAAPDCSHSACFHHSARCHLAEDTRLDVEGAAAASHHAFLDLAKSSSECELGASQEEGWTKS
jgi:hypothetical protein